MRWLSRRAITEPNVHVFTWNVERGHVDERALDGVDHIVHLSGEGIADKRWDDEQKQKMEDAKTISINENALAQIAETVQ